MTEVVVPQRTSRRRIVPAVIASIVLLWGVAEWLAGLGLPPRPEERLLRIKPDRSYRFAVQPYLDMQFEGFTRRRKPVRIITDGEGFRVGPEETETGVTHRLFVFGDEWVFGEGLEAAETFPAHVGVAYFRAYNEQIRVHNAGVPGYNVRLSLERLLHQIRKGEPFDWVLVLSEDDLRPPAGNATLAYWGGALRSRLTGRWGYWSDRRRQSRTDLHENSQTLAPLIDELSTLAKNFPLPLPCVVVVPVDSALHTHVADQIARAARCQVQEGGKQLSVQIPSPYQPGGWLPTAEAADYLATRFMVSLSAALQYKPLEWGNTPAPPPGSSD
ncbi:MAG: SGNH/GDSL hydrolase family protein [Deltaproteobacteria bacterium]|nr:SGNH/GDSL hydrolase family protein [Deltaproteobacteria bacterium]